MARRWRYREPQYHRPQRRSRYHVRKNDLNPCAEISLGDFLGEVRTRGLDDALVDAISDYLRNGLPPMIYKAMYSWGSKNLIHYRANPNFCDQDLAQRRGSACVQEDGVLVRFSKPDTDLLIPYEDPDFLDNLASAVSMIYHAPVVL